MSVLVRGRGGHLLRSCSRTPVPHEALLRLSRLYICCLSVATLVSGPQSYPDQHSDRRAKLACSHAPFRQSECLPLFALPLFAQVVGMWRPGRTHGVQVIVLVGTGWSYMKPLLAQREKRILMVVIPLQV